MGAREKYGLLEKDGKNVFSIYEELRKTNTSIKVMVIIREVFPDLSLIEAKEIMILSETDNDSIEEYQKELFGKSKKA